MKIKYRVNLAALKRSFDVVYVEEFHNSSDSQIELYNCYKISVLLSDGLAAVLGDRIVNSGKNILLFFRPDEIHFGRFFATDIYKYLDFYIPCDLFQKLFGNNASLVFFTDTSDDRINYISLNNIPAKHIIENITKTVTDLKNSRNKQVQDIKLFCLMLQLVTLCSENYETQKREAPKNKMPVFVTKTLSYISEFYAQRITIDILASNAGCSVAYLARVFKQYMGKTVYHHILDVRIANSQFFLNQNYSVTETCFLCGFNDCSNFIRAFKKLTGKTPHQYKNSAKFTEQ